MTTRKIAAPPERPYADLSDEDLARLLRDKEKERERYRERRGPFRDDAHAGIDASVEGAREVLVDRLSDRVGDLAKPGFLPVIPGIADAWVLANDPGVAAAWHQMVDEMDPSHFDLRSRDEFTTGMDALTAEVAALFREQRLRDLDQQRERLEREAASA